MSPVFVLLWMLIIQMSEKELEEPKWTSQL